MKFRKKPVVVEAEQWFPEHPVEGVTFPAGEHIENLYGTDRGMIQTPEGPHVVSPGDWIVTNMMGEKRPVKPDVFAATYEFVP